MRPRRPLGGVAIDPLYETAECALRARRARAVDDSDDDEAPALPINHIARERPHAVERPCLEQRLPGDGAVLEAALHGAVHRCDRERARELLAHAARVGGDEQAGEASGGDALASRQSPTA